MQKTINFDDATTENQKINNLTWAQTSDHPYEILIIRCSRYGRKNS